VGLPIPPHVADTGYLWQRRGLTAALLWSDRRAGGVQKGVIGTAVIFACSGAAQATWLSRLPALAEDLSLGPRGIGYALGWAGLGLILGMPAAGRLCSWLGMRRVIVWAAVLACVAVSFIGSVNTTFELRVAMLAFGLAGGVWDGSMNVHGSTVERQGTKPRMQLFHGLWSAGASVGAFGGAIAEATRTSVALHITAAAVICAIGCLLAGLGLLPGRPDPEESDQASTRRLTLAGIGLLLLCAAVVEGAAADWLPTLFATEHEASPAMGAAVYGVIAAAMAAGRFLAVPAQQRWGRVATVRYGALAAAAGALLILVTPDGPFSFVGALFWGVGIAPAFPAAVSTSGEGKNPADLVAVTTLVGYLASLVGPLFVGSIADRLGLRVTLFVVPALAMAVFLLARAVRPVARDLPERAA
jgi:MFS family permease